MIDILTANEVNYLALYTGTQEVFGVDTELNEAHAMRTLIDKEVINKNNLPEKDAVMIVELIRRYNNANYYIHFQNFVIAILDDKWCVVKRIQEGIEKTYRFGLSAIEGAFRIMFAHPLIASEILDNKQLLKDSYLLIELFDKEKILKSNLAITYQEETYYKLDDQLQKSDKLDDCNIVEWLQHNLHHDYINKLNETMEGIHNERKNHS